MRIIRTDEYINSLLNILEFIALDSKKRALEFRSEIDKHINNLSIFPYKFRRSLYFDDESIRDLIFKGYTIPYKIDTQNNQIIILGIKKYTKEL